MNVNTLRQDIPAGLVVFLVALRLPGLQGP